MKKNLTQSLKFTGVGLFILYIFKVLIVIQAGASVKASLFSVLTNWHFWLKLAAPFVLICFPVLFFAPKLHRLMTSGGQKRGFVWKKAVLTYAIMGYAFLLLLGVLLFEPLIIGRPYLTWDQFATLTVLWAGYGIFVTCRLLMKPDADLIKAYEAGEPERYHDERQQQIFSKAAVSTLYAFIFVVLFGGFVFDIFVTHIWPVRSLAEIVIMFLIGFVNIQRWSKRI